MRVSFFLICFLFTAFSDLSAQHDKKEVNEQAQKAWIKNTLLKHSSIHLDSLPIVEPDIRILPDFSRCSYRLSENSRIIFKDKSWAAIYINSSHSDKVVGDICILVSSKKKKYVNFGHICGGIIHFESKIGTIPENIKDFVQRFVSDTDKSGWMKY